MTVGFSLFEEMLCILQKRTTTPAQTLIYKLHTNECLYTLSLLFNCPHPV